MIKNIKLKQTNLKIIKRQISENSHFCVVIHHKKMGEIKLEFALRSPSDEIEAT